MNNKVSFFIITYKAIKNTKKLWGFKTKVKLSLYIKTKSILGIDDAEYFHVLLWGDLQDGHMIMWRKQDRKKYV